MSILFTLGIAVVVTLTWTVRSNEIDIEGTIKYRVGPKMCIQMCERLSRCHQAVFKPNSLTCSLVYVEDIHQTNGIVLLTKDNVDKTAKRSRRLLTRTKGYIYVEKTKHRGLEPKQSCEEDTSNSDIKKYEKDMTLQGACMLGRLNVVKYLVSNKPEDVNKRNTYGETPVMIAARHGHTAVFKYLVCHGANLTTVSSKHGNVLHLACQSGAVDIADYILTLSRSYMNKVDDYGTTPAGIAVINDDLNMVKLLVSKGLDIEGFVTGGETILHVACRHRQTAIIKYIISLKKPDIDINEDTEDLHQFCVRLATQT